MDTSLSSNFGPILVAEDSDEDYEMLVLAFKRTGVENKLIRFSDGDEMLDFLFARGAHANRKDEDLPKLIMLDLNLIGTDGRVVLREIKKDLKLKTIPVVVLTTSSNPKDVSACYAAGVNSYALKPVDLDRFERFIDLFREFWLEHTVLP